METIVLQVLSVQSWVLASKTVRYNLIHSSPLDYLIMDFDELKLLVTPPTDLTYPTAGAIASTIVLYRFRGAYDELISELFCWALVILWFEVIEVYCRKKKSALDVDAKKLGFSIWVVGAGLVLVSIVRGTKCDIGVEWVVVSSFYPILMSN